MKRALITGITGQDGSYLAELLLGEGLRGPRPRPPRVDRSTAAASTTSTTTRTSRRPAAPALRRPHRRRQPGQPARTQIQPDEVYNLGAQSHVQVSFEMPEYTASTDGARHASGCSRRSARPASTAASTRRRRSEMFGATPPPQNEDTPFYPRCPYGAAKVYALLGHASTTARPTACSRSTGILFNHESPRRGETFVTRKITRAVARDQGRPAGRARTSATSTPCATGATPRSTSRACGGCSSTTSPTTTSLATGTARTGRATSCELAFAHAGLDWEEHVALDERYERPTEVDALIGDAVEGRARCSAGRPQTARRTARPAHGRRRHRAVRGCATSSATTTALVTGVGWLKTVCCWRGALLADGHRVVGTRVPGPLPPLAPYLAGVELREHDIAQRGGLRTLAGDRGTPTESLQPRRLHLGGGQLGPPGPRRAGERHSRRADAAGPGGVA